MAAPPDAPVVCMQNGVENERRVLRHFPNTYGMCVMCPASQLRPGVVQVHSAPVSGLLDLGRFPSGLDERGQAIADAIATTTFQSVARPDIMRWKYRKLLMNLANAVEALCGPEGRFSPLAREAQREGKEALAAAGIDVASSEEDRERRGDFLQMSPTSSGEWQGGSSWQSLARGAGSIEADFLNGEIVLQGALHGVPTPVNALLQRLASRAAAEGAPPGIVERRGAEQAGGVARWRVSGRAALADDFAAANAEAVVPSPARCPEQAWMRPVPGEEWTVGVVLAPHRREPRQERALAGRDGSGRGRAPTPPRRSTGPTRRTPYGRRPSRPPRRSPFSTDSGARLEAFAAGPQRRGARPQRAVRTGRGPGLSDGRPGGGAGPPHP